jgi:hypothetical protein
MRKTKRIIYMAHDRIAAANRNHAHATSVTPIVPRDIYKSIKMKPVPQSMKSHDKSQSNEQSMRGSALLFMQQQHQ